jgi:hypothetical protein
VGGGWLEVQRSVTFIREQLAMLPGSAAPAAVGALAPESLAVSLIEGWRSEICHVALTDADGRFPRCVTWWGKPGTTTRGNLAMATQPIPHAAPRKQGNS